MKTSGDRIKWTLAVILSTIVRPVILSLSTPYSPSMHGDIDGSTRQRD
jgi:hypothetical protein